MRTSEKTDLLSAALVKIQFEMEPAEKNSLNPHFRSKFANLAAVWAAALPALHRHGVAVFQGGSTEEGQPVLVTRVMHSSGQWIEAFFPLVCEKPNSPQAMGSAITYNKRYGLLAALGITTSDEVDDDAEGAMKRDVEIKNVQVPSGFGNSAPIHCDKPMMISKFNANEWYCLSCKAKSPVVSRAG